MIDVDELQVPPMKVGIVGPTGIGKTSVLAALLHEARTVLGGTDVQVTPGGDTRQRVDALVRRLRGHVRRRSFSPDKGVQTSSDAFTFKLALTTPALPGDGVRLEFLDYPGAWLVHPERAGQAWTAVEEFLRASDVLMVPIASALLMEWRTTGQDEIVADYLRVEEVERVVELWAKARAKAGRGGALLLLPVRCEAYLNDNGGTEDKYAELEARVADRYEPIRRTAARENDRCEVLFCPVDTMGCVEFARIGWREKPPKIEFIIRGKSPTLSPRGGGDVFTFLVGRYLDLVASLQAEASMNAALRAENAVQRANRDEGVFINVLNWLTGVQRAREEHAEELSGEAQRKVQALSALGRTLQEVRDSRPSGRLKTFSQPGAGGAP